MVIQQWLLACDMLICQAVITCYNMKCCKDFCHCCSPTQQGQIKNVKKQRFVIVCVIESSMIVWIGILFIFSYNYNICLNKTLIQKYFHVLDKFYFNKRPPVETVPKTVDCTRYRNSFSHNPLERLR